MINTNKDAQSMESLMPKAVQSGISNRPASRGIYETGKSGAWKTWHGGSTIGAKGGIN